MTSFFATWHFLQLLMHRVAFWAIALLAIGMLVATALSATGALPWLELPMSFGGQPYDNAGQMAQIGFTIFAVMLAFFLPSNKRLMALETSHRSFSMGVADVARAYHHAHVADRNGNFQLSSEYDAIRERLVYLRDHPDLGALEPDILELAAQMSYASRDLATTYSDENVGRARTFLTQRQQEVERFNARLERAQEIHQELMYWRTNVELEESVATSQLTQLKDDLQAILPELSDDDSQPTRNVIGLTRAAE